MTLTLRPGAIEDAKECGRVYYEAFKFLAEQHGFPSEVQSVEIATILMTLRLNHSGFYSVVAEQNGKIVGSIFLDERSIIGGVGPISVEPRVMNGSIGQELMKALMIRATQRHFPGLRGMVVAWHYHAFALYIKHGGTCRETFSVMQGKPLACKISGHDIRHAGREDLSACNQLCYSVHGHDRSGELVDAIHQGKANVVERLGRITGYSTGIGWSNHAVAESNDDMKALISAAPELSGLGFFVPSSNGELFRWCLSQGLRVVCQTNLMTHGLYNQPAGVYLPSISY
ncbi:GNAT family N-acetyltransferase [Vibrio natriegens]|uniref:GNAT family N-acetyltransferase n=1 Tax=Vibrio natriegens TaxID=691 RepID=UPI0015943AC2|nr:GNAT family N-acetyltransferase [Vibrio natriegens]NVC95292.1 GNAT family N-acetyltransferase [Vibrio natriegens]